MMTYIVQMSFITWISQLNFNKPVQCLIVAYLVCCFHHPCLTFPVAWCALLLPFILIGLFLMKEVCGWTLNVILIIEMLVNWAQKNMFVHDVAVLWHLSVHSALWFTNLRLSSCAPCVLFLFLLDHLPFIGLVSWVPSIRISALTDVSKQEYWVLTESNINLKGLEKAGAVLGTVCGELMHRSSSAGFPFPKLRSAEDKPSSFSNSPDKNSSG